MPRPVSLFVPSVTDLATDPATKIKVSFTFSNLDVEYSLAPVEFYVDVPIPLGCYNATRADAFDPAHVTTGTVDPIGCLQQCLSAGLRFAFLVGGDTCVCRNSVFDLVSVDDGHCNVPCSGDASDLCGSPAATDGGVESFNTYVATCPSGKDRFGDYCYAETAVDAASVLQNEDACSEMVKGPCQSSTQF